MILGIWETVHGIRLFMGWTRIPDMGNSSFSGDDNPFTAPKQQPPGKISVKLPINEWLCEKIKTECDFSQGIFF